MVGATKRIFRISDKLIDFGEALSHFSKRISGSILADDRFSS